MWGKQRAGGSALFFLGDAPLGRPHIEQVSWTKKGKAGMIVGAQKEKTEELVFAARFLVVPNYIL